MAYEKPFDTYSEYDTYDYLNNFDFFPIAHLLKNSNNNPSKILGLMTANNNNFNYPLINPVITSTFVVDVMKQYRDKSIFLLRQSLEDLGFYTTFRNTWDNFGKIYGTQLTEELTKINAEITKLNNGISTEQTSKVEYGKISTNGGALTTTLTGTIVDDGDYTKNGNDATTNQIDAYGSTSLQDLSKASTSIDEDGTNDNTRTYNTTDTKSNTLTNTLSGDDETTTTTKQFNTDYFKLLDKYHNQIDTIKLKYVRAYFDSITI